MSPQPPTTPITRGPATRPGNQEAAASNQAIIARKHSQSLSQSPAFTADAVFPKKDDVSNLDAGPLSPPPTKKGGPGALGPRVDCWAGSWAMTSGPKEEETTALEAPLHWSTTAARGAKTAAVVAAKASGKVGETAHPQAIRGNSPPTAADGNGNG